jgi:Protein of unknown function (DUF3015)
MKLNTKLIVAVLSLGVSAGAMAAGENNVGSCGLGSKLFAGQSGIPAQVMAVTTNGTFGNQTFGISTGTLGCTQDGAVTSNWQTALFIDGNKEKLARDVSRGGGETLESFAQLMGMSQVDKAHFYRTAKSNFDRIFPSAQVSTDDVLNGFKLVIAEDAALQAYSTKL